MEIILLYSKKQITFKGLETFLNLISLKFKGVWNEASMEVDCSKKEIDEIVFGEQIKYPKGLTFMCDFLISQVTVNLSINHENNFEMMIFLDSLDYSERDSIKANVKKNFNFNNIFQMIVFQEDDELDDTDWSFEFDKLLTKDFRAVQYLGFSFES